MHYYTKIGIETVLEKNKQNTAIWPFILILWVDHTSFSEQGAHIC